MRVFALSMLLAVGLAQAAPAADADASRITSTLAELAVKAKAQACFDKTRVILIGYSARQKGTPVERWVSEGLVQPGTEEYRLLTKGYELNDVADRYIGEYFSGCLE